MKRAQDAEKLLKQNKPQEAIRILQDLDRKYPTKSPLSLRLAQIYDQNDDLGPALFYYRRYVKLSGERARSEAKERLYTLEMMPGSREAADAFGKKLGEATQAFSTPTPAAREEVGAAREDGSLVPLQGPEQLDLIAKAGLPPPSLTPAAATPTPYVFNISRSGDSSSPLMVTPTPRPTPRSVYATKPPQGSIDEDAALAQAFSRGIPPSGPASPAATQPPEAMPIEPGATPFPQVPSLSSQQPTQPTPYQRPRQASSPAMAFTSPTPQQEVVSPRASRFFTVKKIGGDKAVLKLWNNFPDSVATVAVLPEDQGEVINAILAKDERREFTMLPGEYEVNITVSTTNYPPLSVLDTKFKFQFEAGYQYSRRLDSDIVQQVN